MALQGNKFYGFNTTQIKTLELLFEEFLKKAAEQSGSGGEMSQETFNEMLYVGFFGPDGQWVGDPLSYIQAVDETSGNRHTWTEAWIADTGTKLNAEEQLTATYSTDIMDFNEG